jgi:hypothetical protein
MYTRALETISSVKRDAFRLIYARFTMCTLQKRDDCRNDRNDVQNSLPESAYKRRVTQRSGAYHVIIIIITVIVCLDYQRGYFTSPDIRLVIKVFFFFFFIVLYNYRTVLLCLRIHTVSLFYSARWHRVRN